ncbi:MAG: hypothetical protein OIF32_13035, partial [Campylobacterales bacterium]|nr:hypothetical protein [Campylobacterales bacterium]
AQGSQTKKTPHSDIYSLGAILYSILTHKVPIDGQSLDEVIKKTIQGQIIPPRSIDKSISSSLEAICLKALSTSPEKRYQSTSELISDIELYLNGFAPKAEKINLLKKIQLFIRRRPLLFIVILTSISLIALISLSTSYIFSKQKEQLEYQKAEINTQKYKIEKHLNQVKKSQEKLQTIATLAAKGAFETAYEKYLSYHLKDA